jgi:uncharacterized membrane protein YjfL (UPF0719 family)
MWNNHISYKIHTVFAIIFLIISRQFEKIGEINKSWVTKKNNTGTNMNLNGQNKGTAISELSSSKVLV